MSQQKNVNDFIGPNEFIQYVGSYDVTTRVLTPGSNDQSGTSGVITNVAGICGFSFRIVNYNYAQTGLVGTPRYIDENYSLSTVDTNDPGSQFLGNCAWQGSYPDFGSIGVTAIPIFCFGVSSSTGVYSNIVKVVIDFTNKVRVLYFIATKPPNTV